MPNKLFDHLRKEWKTLTNAPFAFLSILVLASTSIFFIVDWHYGGTLQTLTGRIELLKDRIQAKDDQLDDYRERLHLTPASGSKFSKMTHQELKDSTLSLVKKLRDFLFNTNQKSKVVKDKLWSQMVEAKTEEEKSRLWQAHTDAITQYSYTQRAEYEKKFKIDAILLRDEILTRIPRDSINKSISFSYYEYPTNYLVMKEVADDLERLAKLLN